ncbi:MAG TPA: rhomboid family intramembrane serine protease [Pseudonocardiaceae bacterium]|nr:rhomboid family intramembrane serine protease [Pseudonocardiaceae bacterium]
MDSREVLLYVCAGTVIVAGIQVIGGASGPATPDRLIRVAAAAWRRMPWLTATFLLVTTVLTILQWPFPAVLHALERDPNGQWWRLFTAQFVQSSGLVQTLVNLPALALVGAVAETVLGRARWLLVYLGSGVAANAVSTAGWSPTGAGTSVFICGLVGALATVYLLRGPADWPLPRRLAPLVVVAGIVLCVLANNHGVGLLTGCVLGALAGPVGARLNSTNAEPVGNA